MRFLKSLRGCVVALASTGMVIPQVAFGAGTVTPVADGSRQGIAAPIVKDLALQPGGLLRGQVVNSQGAPVAGSRVVIGQQAKAVAETQTDADGRFVFSGLRGGVYQVATAQGGAVYRLWSVGAAPPAAQSEALVVNNDTVVRGGLGDPDCGGLIHGHGSCIGFFSNPWVLGCIVAAAIAIPLAVANNNNEGS